LPSAPSCSPWCCLFPKILHARAQPALHWLLFSHFLGSQPERRLVVPADRLGDQLRSGNRWSDHVHQRDSSASRQNPDASARRQSPANLGRSFLLSSTGGRFPARKRARSACGVQLFVGAESVWVLDRRFQPLLKIPVGEITAASARAIRRNNPLALCRMTWAQSHHSQNRRNSILLQAAIFCRASLGAAVAERQPSRSVMCPLLSLPVPSPNAAPLAHDFFFRNSSHSESHAILHNLCHTVCHGTWAGKSKGRRIAGRS